MLVALSPREIELLVIIGLALALILSSRLRPDLVALMVLLSLGIIGILTPEQAVAGFSRSAVLTIVGLFVITATLEHTGVVQWLADQLARLGGTHEIRMIAVFMGAGALLSLVMNNIAAGAVLLPAAVSVTRQANVRESRILVPLAFGTLLGGMATLFTTANIIVSGSLQAQAQRALTMLDFLPVGSVIVLSGRPAWRESARGWGCRRHRLLGRFPDADRSPGQRAYDSAGRVYLQRFFARRAGDDDYRFPDAAPRDATLLGAVTNCNEHYHSAFARLLSTLVRARRCQTLDAALKQRSRCVNVGLNQRR